jgi:ubiquinone/menaquinone biosynthesis C-methylase UbiE
MKDFQRKPSRRRDTSWQGVANKYQRSVGSSGHYYHQHVVIPEAKKLLDLKPNDSVLDLGCGQGVLARAIRPDIDYLGVDLSSSLVRLAEKQNRNDRFEFMIADITESLNLPRRDFSHAAIILALQNVEDFSAVINNAAKHLKSGGQFLIVINHPYFRIPRQTSWGIDEKSKLQYRRVNMYMSPLKIPIDMGPGGEHKLTWSFHNPLSAYSEALAKAGFTIAKVEEWVSDKESEGKAKKMENRSRAEIPLFMAILAEKR